MGSFAGPRNPDQRRPANRKQDAIEAGRYVCVDGVALFLDTHVPEHLSQRLACTLVGVYPFWQCMQTLASLC